MSENESIPIGSESVEAEELHESEETPVIDVHAPQGGLHTWKDFWIHLGTITLGLLIAIGLEQSVEKIHHLHQRNQLKEDLREEGLQNQDLAENDWRIMDDRMAGATAALREVESTLATRRKTAPPFPASSFQPPSATGKVSFTRPLSTVWATAKESALIDLLPRDLARSYTRLYLQEDVLEKLAFDADAGMNDVKAYECRFSDGTLPCKADLSLMTDEQLGEYSGLLTRSFVLLQVEKTRVLIFEEMNDRMLKGELSEHRMVDAVPKIRAEHPDVFLRPLPAAK
jgi:hypothetical protein